MSGDIYQEEKEDYVPKRRAIFRYFIKLMKHKMFEEKYNNTMFSMLYLNILSDPELGIEEILKFAIDCE